MTETTTTAPPIHWSAIEPGVNNEGKSEVRTQGQIVAHFAAMALAQSAAFRKNGALARPCTVEGTRAAIDNHMHPMIAAFAAAAALNGWPIDQIEGTLDDAQDMDEWCWEWLTEAGLTQDQIDRLTYDLNAPDVITSL